MESGLDTVQTAALLFPDYDSLRSGLAKDLYEQERVVQEYFEQAAHITTLNITRLMFNSSESEVRALPDAYALLFLLQASAVEYLRSKNITFTQVGGYGLGVYGALFAAETFTFPDGLYMLSKWATAYNDLLHEKNFKKIQVEGISRKVLEKKIEEQDTQLIALSEKISETIYVITGIRSVVETCQEYFQTKYPESAITELSLESGLYADLAPESIAHFKQYLEKVEFKDATVTCFAPDSSHDLVHAQEIKDFVSMQPCTFQDRVQLIERYAHAETIIIPFADEALFAQVKARYPEKNIINLI